MSTEAIALDRERPYGRLRWLGFRVTGGRVLVFGGGIIPDGDISELERVGVRKIFTPGATMQEIVDWVRSNVGQRV